ncbi:MAG: hypothetical protein MZU97_17260 [Bacillus subtilis]|nr:hypothetical protein [Bacillus subtilis]
MNSRYYSSEMSRFINSDGLFGPVGDILGHNMYAYCVNNPVMNSDISGYAPEWLGDALSILATVAVVTILVIAAVSTGGIGGAALLAIASGISIGSINGAVDAIKNETSIAAGVIGGIQGRSYRMPR